jgi:F-type H+-transporting ATPase subunit epsilon
MQLGVYSLEKVLFKGEAAEVNCVTAGGEITILDHHAPLISILAKGTMKVIDAEKKAHYFPVSGGFLEVGEGNRTKILVEEAGA